MNSRIKASNKNNIEIYNIGGNPQNELLKLDEINSSNKNGNAEER